jgi:hypothetical protein
MGAMSVNNRHGLLPSAPPTAAGYLIQKNIKTLFCTNPGHAHSGNSPALLSFCKQYPGIIFAYLIVQIEARSVHIPFSPYRHEKSRRPCPFFASG